MKPSRLLSFIALLIVIFLAAWWFWKSKRVPPVEAPMVTAPTSSVNTVVPSGTTSQPDVSKTNPASAPPSASNSVDPKVAAFQAVMATKNETAQDFYGKAIDQYGKPVSDATVLGTLLWMQGFDIGEKREQHTIQTDQNGEFQFTGFHAARLAVAVSKQGYEMDSRGRAYTAPNAENKTSPAERAIFHMWKLKGAEPMVHTTIQAGIACDGTARSFDLLSGRRDAGNLIATLTRTPVNIDRGKPFDWTLTLSIPEGGLVAITDPYPNEAPASGYQTVSIHMPADSKAWSPSVEQSFYLYDGKYYGRVTVNIMADYQPPPTHIEFEAFINPSSSRNLEFDPTQAIKP